MNRLHLLIIATALFLVPTLARAQVNLDSGLIAYYPFNGNANDESGNGNDGVVYGATLTTDRFNQEGRAYSFDQSYIQVKDSSILRVGAVSISVWLAPTSVSTQQVVLGKIDQTTAAGEQYQLTLDPPTGLIRFSVKQGSFCTPGFGWQPIQSDSSAYLNNWTHVVGTFEDSVHRIYRNGVLVLETILTQPEIDSCSGGDIQIGAWWQGGFEYYFGKIDDLRLYNRAITADEVDSLYLEQILSTSVSSPFGVDFSLFPNPTSGIFHLRASLDAPQRFSLTIVNALGQVVWEQHSAEPLQVIDQRIDLGELPNGVYHLRLEGEKASSAHKLLLQR